MAVQAKKVEVLRRRLLTTMRDIEDLFEGKCFLNGRQLACLMDTPYTTLKYHLDLLENSVLIEGVPGVHEYRLTRQGRAVVARWAMEKRRDELVKESQKRIDRQLEKLAEE